MTLLQDWLRGRRRAGPSASRDRATARERSPTASSTRAANRLARALVEGGCRKGDRVVLPRCRSRRRRWSGCSASSRRAAMHVPLDLASPAARLAAHRERRAEPTLRPRRGRRPEQLLERARRETPRSSVALGWSGWKTACRRRMRAAFTLTDVEREASDCHSRCGRDPQGLAAHPVHLGLDRTAEGRGDHARQRDPFVDWGADVTSAWTTTDRVSGHSPLHFDLSTFDIFGAFAAGAELHLVPPELHSLPHALAEFIRESRADAVVLGAVGAQLHGAGRRRAPGRFLRRCGACCGAARCCRRRR